jgi:hypothetical protein
MPEVPGRTSPAPPSGATDCLFEADGDRLLPTILTQGPWDPTAQHGGPVAGALARAVERVPALVPMRVARLTIDLMRAAPLRPLRSHAVVVREGKRVQLVRATLSDGDTEVAHVLALRVRLGDTSGDDVAEHPNRPVVALPPVPDGRGEPLSRGDAARFIGFLRAIEAERTVGRQGAGSPSVMWIRQLVPTVAGEETTPLQRLALASDFTSASAAWLDTRDFTHPNPDITLYVHRAPVSDWIGVQADTFVGPDGIGVSRAVLFDLEGMVGLGSASQIVDRRDERMTW